MTTSIVAVLPVKVDPLAGVDQVNDNGFIHVSDHWWNVCVEVYVIPKVVSWSMPVKL